MGITELIHVKLVLKEKVQHGVMEIVRGVMSMLFSVRETTTPFDV